jgi:plasmid stabilization system protein ParE
MRAVFHPAAYEEMLESARYLETKTPGLGFDLMQAVQESTQRVIAFPTSGSIERAKIRKSLVRGFPFTILYEARQDHIFIAAVMHQRRKPGYWRDRVK